MTKLYLIYLEANDYQKKQLNAFYDINLNERDLLYCIYKEMLKTYFKTVIQSD